jgi:hypothetical protein
MKALSKIATLLERLRAGLAPVTLAVWSEEMVALSPTVTPPERLAAEQIQAISLAFAAFNGDIMPR